MVDFYQLPADIRTMQIRRPQVQIYYPNLVNLKSPRAQQAINQEISKTVQGLIKEQTYEPGKTEMNGMYEIKNNQRGIVSTTLSNYAYTQHYAHGMTYIKSVTANINTGEIYQLANLFKPGSDYVQKISKIIQVDLKARDLPLLDGFNKIKPNQDFYIADKCLVIYFQLYEITPYYVGLPMFPISVYELADIVKEDGPLGIMMPY